MRRQLFAQSTAGLDVQRLIDRFMGHTHLWFIGVIRHKARRDLLRRPEHREPFLDFAAQARIEREFCSLGSSPATNCSPFGMTRAVRFTLAVDANITRNR